MNYDEEEVGADFKVGAENDELDETFDFGLDEEDPEKDR